MNLVELPADDRHLIADLMPAAVVSAEAFGDVAGAVLLGVEEAVVARAVDSRRRAFSTARHCARTALRELGVPPVAIPQGERGAPCWPSGIVGSITHCEGYRAAAVAWRDDVIAIGIDAEPLDGLPVGVLRHIACSCEQAHLVGLAERYPEVAWERLLFSAKEAVYKVWYPLTGRQLGFKDVVVAFQAQVGTFCARLLVAPPLVAGERLRLFTGRWRADAGLLTSSVVLTSPSLRRANSNV
jgi:4'-phosphopantetheinyl transferase EntD